MPKKRVKNPAWKRQTNKERKEEAASREYGYVAATRPVPYLAKLAKKVRGESLVWLNRRLRQTTRVRVLLCTAFLEWRAELKAEGVELPPSDFPEKNKLTKALACRDIIIGEMKRRKIPVCVSDFDLEKLIAGPAEGGGESVGKPDSQAAASLQSV